MLRRRMVAVVPFLLMACVPAGGLEAQYANELEACLRLDTCEEYIKCRTEVSQKYNRPFGGSCDD